MTLTYRSTIGRRLTVVEGDGNISHLSQSSGVTFVQSGSGAVATTAEKKLQERVSIFDFMTDAEKADYRAGTLLVDITAAVRLAVNKCITGVTSSDGGGATSGSVPILYFPYGAGKISGDIANGQAINYLKVEGDRAILVCDAAVEFLTGVRYMVDLKGISVRGGAIALKVATGNVNSCMITLDECEFHQQTSRVFDIDGTSNSTQLLCKNTKIRIEEQTGAQVIKALSCDYIKFQDCWVQVDTAADAAFDITDGVLFLERVLGVPGSALFAWVELNGTASLYADSGCRFGGENGGTTDSIVINRASADISGSIDPRVISLQGCIAYTTGSLIHFYAIPNVVDVRGVTGLSSGSLDPILVESTVSAADLASIGNADSIFRFEFNSKHYSPYVKSDSAAPNDAVQGLPRVHDKHFLSSRPDLDDLTLQSQGRTGGFTPTSTQTATRSDITDEFGVTGYQWEATADNQHSTRNYTSALNGLAAGLYTAVFQIEVTTGHTVRPLFRASNVVTQEFTLPHGKHTVCVPFYYDAGAAQTIGFELYNLPDNAIVQWHRFLVFSGRRIFPDASKSVELDGTAAPTSGQFYVRDTVWNVTPATGEVLGWICTVAGTPGTWVPFGVLPSISASNGNADATLTAGTSVPTQLWSTTLTADRAATLSTTGAWNGAKFRVVRSAGGAFNLNVGTGPLKALAPLEWCDVEYNGSAWLLTAFGSL